MFAVTLNWIRKSEKLGSIQVSVFAAELEGDSLKVGGWRQSVTDLKQKVLTCLVSFSSPGKVEANTFTRGLSQGWNSHCLDW